MFLFHRKRSFRSREIQIFVFPSSPFFSQSAIALEVDSRKILKFMTCKNLARFVWYLEKEKKCDIETFSIEY